MPLDWLDAFLITGLFDVFMIMGLALLLHLQLGLARIANFGVVGFWGLGMYVFGVLYVQVDWPFGDPWQFFVCAAAATFVAGLAGALVGWLIGDLDTDGVLVVTLGFASIVQILAITEDEWTGGSRGLGGLRIPFDVGKVKEDEFVWLLVLAAVVIAMFLYARQVHRSPYGRLLIGTGSNEALARSLGKSTYRTKLWMFALTSAGMGLLGAMSAAMVRYLDIGNIGVGVTLAAIVGLVLGGTARVWGAVIGVILTVGLFDIIIRFYVPLPREWYTQAIPTLREVVFGATLIIVLMFRPLGILGDMRRDKLMRKTHGK
jgi:branched-chain amino acid transport system permease protein